MPTCVNGGCKAPPEVPHALTEELKTFDGVGFLEDSSEDEDEDDHEDNDKVPLTEELKTFVGSVYYGGRH